MPFLTHDKRRNIWGYGETEEKSLEDARYWLASESWHTFMTLRATGRKLITVPCSDALYYLLTQNGNVQSSSQWRMRKGVAIVSEP